MIEAPEAPQHTAAATAIMPSFCSTSAPSRVLAKASTTRCRAGRTRAQPRAVEAAQQRVEAAALAAFCGLSAACPAIAAESAKVNFGEGGNADPKSYYTVLALFLLSVPGELSISFCKTLPPGPSGFLLSERGIATRAISSLVYNGVANLCAMRACLCRLFAHCSATRTASSSRLQRGERSLRPPAHC